VGRSARTGPYAANLADELARSIALGQSQQIVLPLAVSVCPEVRGFVAIARDDLDVHFFSS